MFRMDTFNLGFLDFCDWETDCGNTFVQEHPKQKNSFLENQTPITNTNANDSLLNPEKFIENQSKENINKKETLLTIKSQTSNSAAFFTSLRNPKVKRSAHTAELDISQEKTSKKARR